MKLKIANLELPSNVIAAPLAGFTDHAWRILARRLGAGLVFSEMVSVGTIVNSKKKWSQYLKNSEEARPFGVQLFGTDPKWFLASLEVIKNLPFDLLDINMGCPVKKIVTQGAGAALMKSPWEVDAILSAVRKAYKGPLTVKIRSGWDSHNINAIEIATIAEDNGVDAITVHPRTRAQGFTGKADWEVIAVVKNKITIPVIGNGDIVDAQSAKDMFATTGCDGIMIGRAALGNPWIFREIAGGEPVTLEEKFSLVREQIDLLVNSSVELHVVNMMKKFIPKYFKGLHGVKHFIRDVQISNSVQEILDHIERFEHFCDNRDGDSDYVGNASID